MGGELGLGTMAGAAQSPDELAWQLDARAATRVKGGAMRTLATFRCGLPALQGLFTA